MILPPNITRFGQQRQSARAIFFFIIVTIGLVACTKESPSEGLLESNMWPFADAGKDTILVFPVNSTILNGGASYDTDGSIVKYQWTQLSGPSLATIHDTTAKQTDVNHLLLGIYKFQLRVTDNKGKFSLSTVTIQVEDSVYPPHLVGFYPFKYTGFSWNTASGLKVIGPVPDWLFNDFPEDNDGSKWIVEVMQANTNLAISVPFVKKDNTGTTLISYPVFYSIRDLVQIFPGENPVGSIYVYANPQTAANIDFSQNVDVILFMKF